jgi:hypothetical protein
MIFVITGDDHPPAAMPAALGWDTLVVEQPHLFGGPAHMQRHRHGNRSPFPPAFMIGGPREQMGGTYNPLVYPTVPLSMVHSFLHCSSHTRNHEKSAVRLLEVDH